MSKAFQWTDMEVAYMAGIFDAAVDVNLTAAKVRDQTSVRFVCRLQTPSKALCDWAADTFDGRLETDEPNARGRYSCHWAPGPALIMITRLLPHLVVKQKEAGLLVDFLGLAWKERKIDVAKRKLALGLVQQLTRLQPKQLAAPAKTTEPEPEPEVIFVDSAVGRSARR